LPALNSANGLAPTAKNIARIATEYGEDAATWAFTQWSLRKRARAKFARADEMFFTKNGLEQATHEAVARYHASRFPKGQLVCDLTCGIGSDLIALAERGPVRGFEIDSETAWCARENVGTWVPIIEGDCMSAKWDFRYAFVDPSRRVGNARTLDPDAFSPNPMDIASRLRGLDFAGMKLSPMLSDDTLAELSGEIEFVSFEGECREAIAWFGGRVDKVSARKVETGVALPRGTTFVGSIDEPLAYLLEADPAAIRAHCLGTLCETHGAAPLADSNGYLTANEPSDSEWLTSYRVLDSGRFDERRVRRALVGAGRVVVKTRGVKIEVAKLSKALSSNGARSAIVVLYPVGKSIRYLIVKALQGDS